MKQWRFEVSNSSGFPDVYGQGIFEDIKELGITSVQSVHSAMVYLIDADFDEAFAKRVAEELLTDQVSQEYYIGRSVCPAGPVEASILEVHLKSGVTDPVAESVTTALNDMGVNPEMVRTGRKFIILGHITDQQAQTIARRVLANDCTEDVIYGTDAEPPSPHTKPYELTLKEIPITTLDDDGLMKLKNAESVAKRTG